MEDRRKTNINEEAIKLNLEFIAKEISEIKEKYATKDDILLLKSEFLPVKIVVYTITSVAGIGALTALLNLIIKQ